MSAGRLVFDNDIELIDAVAADDGYWFEAIEGISFGQPVPVEVILTSLLRDGSLVSKSGDDNREVAIPFRVCGSDLLALADGEARMSVALGKRTTLEWTPPDGIGPTTVFDVQTSDLDNPPMDDLAELRNQRTYTLKLTCLPFGRSVGKISDTAGSPPSAGGTVFANCESTTGWSTYDMGSGGQWVSPSFSVDTAIYSEGAGSLKSLLTQWDPGFTYNTGNGTGGYLSPAQGYSRDQITGLSLSTGTGGYLSVAYRGDPSMDEITLTGLWVSTSAGVWTEVPSWTVTKRDANGFVHIAWAVQGGLTVLGLRFQVFQKRMTDHVARPYTWYDDFELLPSATTDHQITKQLDVKGSARTTGSLHIAAPGDSISLGQVLAITAPTDELPAGFQPDGARWATQGTTTPDTTALHGQYYSPSATYDSSASKPIFDVPVGMLTSGPYMIVALVKPSASTLNFGVQARLRYGTTDTGPLSTAEITTPTTAGVWQFVTVGTAYLPPLPMRSADTSAKVRLLFKGDVFADVYMIPAWQVEGRTVADFSIVDCGSGAVAAGGPSSNLWIDSPSADQPQGGWWRGPTSDRLNTQSAWPDAKKPGIHTFNPGPLSAFLVSTGAQGPTLALEYFPAWRTNAAL